AADLLQVDLRLEARELALDDLADLSGLDHAVSPLPFHQAFPHPRELAIETAVHDHAADLGDEAAEQMLVQDLFDDDVQWLGAAGVARQRATEALAERGAIGLGQRHRRPDARAHATMRGVE